MVSDWRNEDTYCAARSPLVLTHGGQHAKELLSHSLPGLNKPCDERRLGFVDGVVDGRTVAGVQDFHAEDAHGSRGAHFVGTGEGHVERKNLVGIPRGGCFFERRHFRDRNAVQLIHGAGDVGADVADESTIKDSGLVSLEKNVRTEGRADVVGVSDELAAELVDEREQRIAIEVDPLAPIQVLVWWEQSIYQ